MYPSLFYAQIYGPSTKCASHKYEWQKQGAITYNMNQENKVANFIISLGLRRGGRFPFKQIFEFSRPYVVKNGLLH